MIFNCQATIIFKIRENKHAGGVGLYVNYSYKFRERAELAVNLDDVVETQFIELTTKPKNTLAGIIYRPANENNSMSVLLRYSKK